LSNDAGLKLSTTAPPWTPLHDFDSAAAANSPIVVGIGLSVIVIGGTCHGVFISVDFDSSSFRNVF